MNGLAQRGAGVDCQSLDKDPTTPVPFESYWPFQAAASIWLIFKCAMLLLFIIFSAFQIVFAFLVYLEASVKTTYSEKKAVQLAFHWYCQYLGLLFFFLFGYINSWVVSYLLITVYLNSFCILRRLWPDWQLCSCCLYRRKVSYTSHNSDDLLSNQDIS